MTQRVRRPHRGQSPSSATQLPILAALHARFLLCSPLLYTKSGKSKYFFIESGKFQFIVLFQITTASLAPLVRGAGENL